MDNQKDLKKKRLAKAFGVKSNFYIDDLVYTTTFGKKNEGKLSKQVDRKDKVQVLDDNSTFDLRSKNTKLSVASNEHTENFVSINNPIDNKKADIIGINKKYEEIFFKDNKTYNDNFHIQVAYNILDMNKIMSLYYYNIVYVLNNMCRNQDSEKVDDLIGNISYEINFEDYNPYNKEHPEYSSYEVNEEAKNNPKGFFKFDKDAKGRFPYFKIFKTFKDSKDYMDGKEIKEYNYDVIRILSFIRQNIAHTGINISNGLYNLENELPEDLKPLIEEKFDQDIESLNKDFNKHAERNLWILKEILRDKDISELSREYYKFVVLKDNKNIGINITKVREYVYQIFSIASKDEFNIKDSKYDSYRPKLNLIYDFLIYDYLKDEEKKNGKITDYVNDLRACCNDESGDDKEHLYIGLAKDFAYSHKLNGKVQEFVSRQIDRSIDNPNNIISVSNKRNINMEFSLFSKLIYFITYFLEKKEKNDLITALINKLDNIQTLNETYKAIKKNPLEYKGKYNFFMDSGTIADELRVIKNLSHMEPKLEKAGGSIYEDVFTSLGYTGTRDEMLKEIESLEKNKYKHPVRNFFVNNVIQSTRFKYLIKYSNPKDCRKFLTNKSLITSILLDIPDEQVQKYYDRVCFKKDNQDKKFQVEFLYNKLLKVNYKYLVDRLSDKKEVENLKALLNLYYTVMYLVVKNLVNINSVFIIGFECLERDYAIFNGLDKKEKAVFGSAAKQLSLLDEALKFYNGKKRKHNYNCLKKVYDEFKETPNIGKTFNDVRNYIMHLSLVSKCAEYLSDVSLNRNKLSEINKIVPVYYELYVYTLERVALENNTYLNEKFGEDLSKYKSYNKDLIKRLLAPLGYNLARYKNLTIRDLFYDQYKFKVAKNEDTNNK